jgi:hypothetical protein
MRGKGHETWNGSQVDFSIKRFAYLVYSNGVLNEKTVSISNHKQVAVNARDRRKNQFAQWEFAWGPSA